MPIRAGSELVEKRYAGSGKVERVFAGTDIVHEDVDAEPLPERPDPPVLTRRTPEGGGLYNIAVNMTLAITSSGQVAYDVEWGKQGETQRTYYVNRTGNVTIFRVRQLDGGTNYTFRARTRADGLISEWSPVITIATSQTGGANPPPAITNLVLAPTADSIAVSWNHNLGPRNLVKHYTIYWATESEQFDGNEEAYRTSSRTHLINEGITPETQYTVGVVATNDAGNSPRVSATVTTLAIPANAPGVPRNVVFEVDEPNEFDVNHYLDLHWDAPSGSAPLDSYDAQMGIGDSYSRKESIIRDGDGNLARKLLVQEGSNANPLFQAGTLYRARVRAVNSAGKSKWVNKSLTSPVPPPPPRPIVRPGNVIGLTAAAASDTSVKLTWQAPSNASGTMLYRYAVGLPRNDGTIAWGETSRQSTGGLTFTVDGLQPNTLYYFRVRATNQAGPGAWTQATATTRVSAPGPPRNIQPTIQATSVGFVWLAPNTGGAVDEYRIAWGEGDYDSDDTTSSTSYNITGLTGDTEYDYRIRAESTIGGVSAWVTGRIRTMSSLNPPGPVRNVTAESTHSSFTLAWDLPATGGAPAEYIVGYGVGTESSTNAYTERTVTARTITVVGLQELTAYGYRIRAVNNDGRSGDVSDTVSTKIAPLVRPGPVNSLVAFGTSQNSIRVTWHPPSSGGVPTQYCVEWSTDTSYDQNSFTFGTEFDIIGLTPATTYNIRVVAQNGASPNGNSDPETTTASTTNCSLRIDTLLAPMIDVGEAYSVRLPTAVGNVGSVTPMVSGLPDGLTFDAARLTISGKATVAGTFTIVYAVTDSAGCMATTSFTMIVSCVLSLPLIASRTFNSMVVTNTTLPEAENTTGDVTYNIPEDLPGGLSFDADTRVLSGTPTTSGTTRLTYVATDESGCTASRTLTVKHSILAIPDVDPIEWEVDMAGQTETLPEGTGIQGASTYALTGSLPPGVSFNAMTRVLSGTPTTRTSGAVSLTYTVTDGAGFSTSILISYTANPPALRLSIGIAFPRGRDNTTYSYVLPDIANAAPDATMTRYILTDLPPGLTFTESNRQISGKPNIPDDELPWTGTVKYRVVEFGSVKYGTREGRFEGMMTITEECKLVVPQQSNYFFREGVTQLVNLKPATGNKGPVTYNFQGTLPTGITFNPVTLGLGGTIGADPGSHGDFRVGLRAVDTQTLCEHSSRFVISTRSICDYSDSADADGVAPGVEYEMGQISESLREVIWTSAFPDDLVPNDGINFIMPAGIAQNADVDIDIKNFSLSNNEQRYTLTNNFGTELGTVIARVATPGLLSTIIRYVAAGTTAAIIAGIGGAATVATGSVINGVVTISTVAGAAGAGSVPAALGSAAIIAFFRMPQVQPQIRFVTPPGVFNIPNSYREAVIANGPYQLDITVSISAGVRVSQAGVACPEQPISLVLEIPVALQPRGLY